MSLKKEVSEGLPFLSKTPRRVDLLTSEVVHEDSTRQTFDFEQWPIALFLKGLGALSIDFTGQDPKLQSSWVQRIAKYQQTYLHDPENFRTEECNWDLEEEAVSIRVSWPPKSSKREALKITPITTPPLEAPLGVDEYSVLKFREEITKQSAKDVILRIQSILNEYDKESLHKDPQILGALISDIISIALENRLLEKAVEISETHFKSLEFSWSDDERVIRSFAAYDPKASELNLWSRIFASCPLIRVLRLLDIYLTSAAGPQMVKLLSLRAQNESDELIDICFKEKGTLLKSLHQWLAPHWRPKHFDKIWHQVNKHFEEEDFLQVWIPALLRSSTSRAFAALTKFFEKPAFFKRKKPYGTIQKAILEAISENPTSDAIVFVKEIRPRLHGKLEYQADKILSLRKSSR